MAQAPDVGMSMRALAAVFGVSPSTLSRDVARAYPPDEHGRIRVGRSRGIDGKIRPNRRFDTTARDTRIRHLRESGTTIRAIAEAVGCSVGTVHRVLNAR